MRVASRVVLTVAAVLASVACVHAAGPITREQCFTINPNPEVTSCAAYLPPIVDMYGKLPYDAVPSYQNCVKERCVCTGAAVSTDITTDGIYCNESGWMESGYTTCNTLNHCFVNFWQCINTAAMDRYDNNRDALTSAEVDLTTDIVAHGQTPGEDFEVTDTYRSCRLLMCAAVDSRENCGLITCLPNYTQCNEYMLPPPLPYTHQLCTQGCRAVLLMMALTISIVALSFCCMCCCPKQVIIRAPVIKDASEMGDKKADDDDTDSEAERTRSATQPQAESATHSNHNAHLASNHNASITAPTANANANHMQQQHASGNSTPITEAKQQGNNNDPF